ncbi:MULTISPECIES: LamG domain-containing protein [unclassified Mesorhizobium]|uniref:LamG domain-containing protein n=1 Tax=unclassified Mesorhizobium TaxID=325217 RepID=UPI0003CE4D86|nr:MULTISPECIES: LamG domain-containing protein [unclassified Mesorhizobium]ESY16292.1 hypothetical protein X751_21695 [Mesorhizobium sp. LNJC395A00]WJI76579.1 LamG domain-containing protein [Mesorhizobium sp. C395A]
MFVHMLSGGVPRGRAIVIGGGSGDGDGGFVEPPAVTTTSSGDTTIKGQVKPGSFGKFVYPLATITAGRQYTFRYTPQFSQLAQQGKLAMVGFGLKNSNDFHIVGLRGNGTTGLNKYKVNGTPPNGWNKDSGHTTSDGGASANGTQAGPNYIRLIISADGATYKFQTSPDNVTYTDEYTGAAPTPFSNVSGVATFGIALWFNNADAGPFSIVIDQFADAAAPTGDPYWSNVVLLCGFEGADASTTMTDESLSAHALTTFGNAQIDTGIAPPFGTSSLLLDGSGDYLTTPDHADFNFGTGDFTIELFARTAVAGNNNYLLVQAGAAPNISYRWRCNVTNQQDVAYSSNGTGTNNLVGAIGGVPLTTWKHLCFERSGTKLRLYAAGVMDASSTTIGSSPLFDSTAVLAIGTSSTTTGFNGHLKEIRITKGVARYNNDSGFTAPTAAFPRS